MVAWYRYYALVIAVHALEVAIVVSAVAIIKSIRPAYDITDILITVAVGMIAGAIYLFSIDRIRKYG
jgi:hypothetical protein